MKNIAQKLFTLCFYLLIFAGAAVSQTTSSSEKTPPYEKVNLKFVLYSESTEDVGFDNPKSFWKFKYELRFISDYKDLKGYTPPSLTTYSNLSSAERLKLVAKNNKASKKAWKKSGVLVVKGKVPETLLSTPKNREIIIPVDLTPELKNILAAATDTWANPEFDINLRGTIITQATSGVKSKIKISQGFSCRTKIQTKDSQLWTMNSCGIAIRLDKINNKVVQGGSSLLQ